MARPASDELNRLKDELRHARDELQRYARQMLSIQRAILPPRLPTVPGLDLAVHFANVDGAGGDYYDVRCVGPHHWVMIIADVSGHGLAAAAILALVHALGNAVPNQQEPAAPGEALGLINKHLASRYLADTGKFVTAFAGLYDAESRLLTYSTAGQPPPRLIRGDEIRRLDAASELPLGIEPARAYPNEALRLMPGDRLVLFTDGITESTNTAHSFFGDERLDASLRAPASTAAELLSRIVHSVRTFQAGQPAADDETCLVAVVKPDAPDTPDPRATPAPRK